MAKERRRLWVATALLLPLFAYAAWTVQVNVEEEREYQGVRERLAEARASEMRLATGRANLPPVITAGEFAAIRMGAGAAEVIGLIGHSGRETARSELPEIEGAMPRTVHTIRQWQNSDGSGAVVMFENGRVLSKSEIGLPQ